MAYNLQLLTLYVRGLLTIFTLKVFLLQHAKKRASRILSKRTSQMILPRQVNLHVHDSMSEVCKC